MLLPVGASLEMNLFWTISDIFNALMAWPNLVALICLSAVILRQTGEYFGDAERLYRTR